MSEYKPNPYFHPSSVSKQEKVAVLESYDPVTHYEAVENAPSVEPVAGLTSIIIPVYFNSYPVFHQTGNCIGSIREHTDNAKTPYEIILVINGETEIKLTEPRQSFADKVIQLPENMGWATAINRGIRVASGQYIALVNNDVQVFEYWLEDLQEALLAGLDLVMSAPMYGNPYGRAVEAENLRNLVMDKPIAETFVDFNDFSCILTTKALFAEIGVFDEQFFMYMEDLDFLRRMDKYGKKHASTKRVNIHHIIGSTAMSMSETPKIVNESREKLKAKWGY